MKKMIFILFIGLLMASCSSYIEYDIVFRDHIPDSVKVEEREFLLELVRAASSQNAQSAGKAKDLADILQNASYISREKFTVSTEVVRKTYFNYGSYNRREYIKIKDLNPNKNEIYIYYKMLETGKSYKVKLKRK